VPFSFDGDVPISANIYIGHTPITAHISHKPI
jgi:hypothetical protein